MKLTFKNELNLSHLISFVGTCMMVGMIYGTYQVESAATKKAMEANETEHKEFRTTINRISELQAVQQQMISDDRILRNIPTTILKQGARE